MPREGFVQLNEHFTPDSGPFGGSDDLPAAMWPDAMDAERAAEAFKRRMAAHHEIVSSIDGDALSTMWPDAMDAQQAATAYNRRMDAHRVVASLID